LIDFDVINRETREARKGKKTLLQEFKEYYDVIEKGYENIIVIIINNLRKNSKILYPTRERHLFTAQTLQFPTLRNWKNLILKILSRE
jgi:hypothetical protein